MNKIKPADLKLRDVVRLFDGAFGDGVVHKIADGVVSIFRPYAITADFEYTGGVIPYIGTETVTLFLDDSREVTLIERPTKAR